MYYCRVLFSNYYLYYIIITGNSSVYAKGWTVFLYNRYEDEVLYPNNVLMVYLNIEDSISSFYQTCNNHEIIYNIQI